MLGGLSLKPRGCDRCDFVELKVAWNRNFKHFYSKTYNFMIFCHLFFEISTFINLSITPSLLRMNHHHYQQRLNHQQIQQQQIPPPQLHGNRSNLGGLGQPPQHQVPPPIIPKQHLHQNIATLNQKPPQHVTNSSQNSQIQPTQRISYESEYWEGKFSTIFTSISFLQSHRFHRAI